LWDAGRDRKPTKTTQARRMFGGPINRPERKIMTNAHEKYITINDEIDYWGAMPPGRDRDAETTKIINAAEAAGIAVYSDCQPSQEVRDNGTELDWFTEWCTTGHELDEHHWVNWFRGQ